MNRGRASVSANLRNILEVRDMSDDREYQHNTTPHYAQSPHHPYNQKAAQKRGTKRYVFLTVILLVTFLLLFASFGIWMVSMEYDNW